MPILSGTDFMPTGSVINYAGVGEPAGWAFCQGQEVSRTDELYSSLFSVIGVVFGVGNGSTTFTLPDFRGRVSVGSGTGSGLTTRTIADEFGDETTTDIITHNHTALINVGSGSDADIPTDIFLGVNAAGNSYSNAADAGTLDSDSVTVADNGNGVADLTNMQPSLVMTKIIKL